MILAAAVDACPALELFEDVLRSVLVFQEGDHSEDASALGRGKVIDVDAVPHFLGQHLSEFVEDGCSG